MGPTVTSYIGFVVAVLILVWGVTEIYSRYLRRKKASPRQMDTWVLFKPISPDPAEEPITSADGNDQEKDVQIHSRAQQNGHYSESKKPL